MNPLLKTRYGQLCNVMFALIHFRSLTQKVQKRSKFHISSFSLAWKNFTSRQQSSFTHAEFWPTGPSLPTFGQENSFILSCTVASPEVVDWSGKRVWSTKIRVFKIISKSYPSTFYVRLRSYRKAVLAAIRSERPLKVPPWLRY